SDIGCAFPRAVAGAWIPPSVPAKCSGLCTPRARPFESKVGRPWKSGRSRLVPTPGFDAITTGGFGGVERPVGPLDHAAQGIGSPCEDGDAHAGGDADADAL